MPSSVAVIVFAFVICTLFVLDRDATNRSSKVLWIPVVWLLVVESRPVSLWLGALGLQSTPASVVPGQQYLDGSPVDRFFYTALLGIGALLLATRGQKLGALLRGNAPMLLFVGYCGLSIFWSDFPDVSFKRWIKSLGYLVMVMIVLTESDRTAAVKRLLARTSFVIVPLSILFIRYYPALGRTYDRWTYQPFYIGVTTNKNELGMACLIGGLGALWRFLSEYRNRANPRRTRQLMAHGALLGMVLWLFFVANSMTSLSCFLLAGGIMTATNLRMVVRRPVLVHLLIMLAILAALSALFLDAGGAALEVMGRDPTLTGRTEIWTRVLTLSGSALFGTGFESFWLGERLQRLWDLLGMQLIQAHNGYLEIYLNLGALGLTLLAVVILSGYRNIIRSFGGDSGTAQLKLAFFVTAIIYNLTEAAFGGAMWIVFLLATIAIPEAKRRRIEQAREPFYPRERSGIRYRTEPVGVGLADKRGA